MWWASCFSIFSIFFFFLFFFFFQDLDVVCNGVAISTNPYRADFPGVFINTQRGNIKVTDAKGDILTEQALLYDDGKSFFFFFSFFFSSCLWNIVSENQESELCWCWIPCCKWKRKAPNSCSTVKTLLLQSFSVNRSRRLNMYTKKRKTNSNKNFKYI